MKRMKRILLIVTLCALALSAVGFSACKYGENIKEIEVVSDLGNYHGERVELWRIEYKNAAASGKEVPYYVDDVYICTFPDSSYKIVVDKTNDLAYARKNEQIFAEDLPFIAERARAALGESNPEGYVPPVVKGLTYEQQMRMKNNYLSYVNQTEATASVEIVHFLGQYDMNYAVILKYLPEDTDVPAVQIPVYLDMKYICTLPDPSYKIVFFWIDYLNVSGYPDELYHIGLLYGDMLDGLAEKAQIALGEKEGEEKLDDIDDIK